MSLFPTLDGATIGGLLIVLALVWGLFRGWVANIVTWILVTVIVVSLFAHVADFFSQVS
jgi:hypothetical protein